MSTNIQNPQLHDALRSWIQVVAPSMISRPWFQGEDASSRQLDIDLMHVNSPIHRLEETQALFDIAAQTPEFLWHAAQQPQTGAPGIDHADYFARRVISLFVRQYLAETREANLDLRAFAAIYADLEGYIFRFDEVPIRTTIEIWHVIPEVSPIVISPNTVVRRLTEEERIRSKNLSIAAGRFVPWREEPPVPWLLIEIDGRVGDFSRGMTPDGTETKTYPNLVVPYREALHIGDRMLLALRLIGEGSIWLGFITTFSPNRFAELLDLFEAYDMSPTWVWKKLFDSSFSYADFLLGLKPTVSPYILTSDVAKELPVLCPLLPMVGGWAIPEELDQPLRQFESSFDRENVIDRFIDQWIALEALFAFRREQLKTHKISLRIAQFLGLNHQNRQEIYSMAKGSYDARSAVVHADAVRRQDFPLYSRSTEGYLRRSLVKCLGSQEIPDKKELERQWDLQRASTK